ncbi:hypothetical protein DFR70_11761 [Nocardia tenerifensis]|uniref:Uncharacterized protein n=1 Tax=Nocardia tenerifensis TaxID=228006 RepID=A0A318JVZ1_9NOCA|nr:hypothetical protein DFR70_11761 [Nocardia tenerifensis]
MTGIRSTMTYSLAGAAVWCAMVTGVSAAQPLDSEPVAPGTTALARVMYTAGDVASGSADRLRFDPGPYSSMEECERARARYYDPSQLECVPVHGNR